MYKLNDKSQFEECNIKAILKNNINLLLQLIKSPIIKLKII